MIETVARAICIGLGDDPDREGERLTAYDAAARAAIAAMRDAELTDAMRLAAFDAFEIDNPKQYADGDAARLAVWSAMLTAALGDRP